MRESFIFVTQKERANSNKKTTKIKYSPAHAFTPEERLREETSSFVKWILFILL